MTATYEPRITAEILRWLEYTNRRSILIVSNEGFARWSKASEPAFVRESSSGVATPYLSCPPPRWLQPPAQAWTPTLVHRVQRFGDNDVFGRSNFIAASCSGTGLRLKKKVSGEHPMAVAGFLDELLDQFGFVCGEVL